MHATDQANPGSPHVVVRFDQDGELFAWLCPECGRLHQQREAGVTPCGCGYWAVILGGQIPLNN